MNDLIILEFNHNKCECKYCIEAEKKNDKQAGVAGLIAGKERTIKPEGWDNAHVRK